jgi:phosphate uptake regulator
VDEKQAERIIETVSEAFIDDGGNTVADSLHWIAASLERIGDALERIAENTNPKE